MTIFFVIVSFVGSLFILDIVSKESDRSGVDNVLAAGFISIIIDLIVLFALPHAGITLW